MNKQEAIAELCRERKVKLTDLNAVLDLYKDDRDEEEILNDLDKYPEAARELATYLIIGI